MWPILIGLTVLLILAVDQWWRARFRRVIQTLAREKELRIALEHRHDQITAQKQAEQQALFNSMVEGVLILDGTGRIQLANQSLQEIFSLPGDVRGQTILEAFRLTPLAELVQRLPKQHSVQGMELELPGMEDRYLEVNAAAVLDAGGHSRAFLVVFHDLTRIKQLENTRQEFVANVSHELRTPLSLIKGYVETLLEGAKDDPDQAAAFLQTIEKHANRLTFLIEDLLTISRLESGQIVMNLHHVNVREEAQRSVEDLQARAREKSSTIKNLLPPDLVCRADADRLQQVFFNLIENAIKYGRPCGSVTLNGRRVADAKIEVFLTDDGPGIPPEARERVFERFYRVDRARSRETGGTGLGLSIVKHIVQAHGGEVWVKSELGKGTTFFFTLQEA